MIKNERKKIRLVKFIYFSVLISFIVPAVYLLIKVIFTNDLKGDEFRSYGDYILMLIQCVLGIVVIHIPSFLERRLKVEIPIPLFIMYIIFLYCGIFLGEVRSFYYLVPHWDTMLHYFSSFMAGIFGFMVVSILNKDENINVHMSSVFVSIFAFCFSLTVGGLWEIYEYAFDGLLQLNMQKFMLEDGTQLIGRLALDDTMKDLIIDALGAFLASTIGYFSLKTHKGWICDIVNQGKYKKDTVS